SITSRFFFFIRAGDGIRGATVTGVQTCALPICGNRGRNNIQCDAPDQQARNLPTNLPQHYARRDTPPCSHNGSAPSDGREVLRGAEADDNAPDETGLHLSLTPALPAQARILAPPRRLRQGRPRNGGSRPGCWARSAYSRGEGEVLERSDREEAVRGRRDGDQSTSYTRAGS